MGRFERQAEERQLTNVDSVLAPVPSDDDAEPATTPPQRSVLFARLALGVALFGGAVAWPLLRQGAGRPWDTIWAEDGTIFVHDANTSPLYETLFRGYSGYGLLLNRLLVAPTHFLPVDYIAAYVALAAAIGGALVALFVYRASGSHVPNVWARLALAGACVLTPALAFENEATLVNLFWVVTFATFWAIMSRQDHPLDVAARGLVAFLAMTTSPIAGIFLPLVAVVAWARRQRSDYVVAGAFLAGLVVQLAMMQAAGDTAERASSSLTDFGVGYGVRVLASAAVGETAAMDLWTAWGTTFAWAALVAGAVVAAAIWLTNDRDKTRTALVAIACSVPLFAIPIFLRGSSLSRLVEGSYSQAGTRYYVTPVLLLASAAAILCANASRRWLSVVLAAQVVVVGLLSFGVAADWRIDGPSWVDGVRAAETSCETTGAPEMGIPIAPVGAWQTVLPCDRIDG